MCVCGGREGGVEVRMIEVWSRRDIETEKHGENNVRITSGVIGIDSRTIPNCEIY